MAIALAQEGGLGVIHKNMSIERQTEEVDKVKRSANGIIVDPVTLPPDASVAAARETMDQSNVSGIPITEDGKLVGILTRRDLRFLEDNSLPIAEVMTSEHLVTATGTVTLEEAEKILMAKKVEKLLLVDEDYRLTGLITIKDIDMMRRFPQACKDGQGRLRVGAAVGVFDFERAESLIEKDVDFLVVDSAHGHSANVIETVKQIKAEVGHRRRCRQRGNGRGMPRLDRGGCRRREGRHRAGFDLHDAGHLGHRCSADYGDLQRRPGGEGFQGTTIIADGGIRYSGDITKAIAAGAHVVMIGGLLAGLDESPGERVLYQGPHLQGLSRHGVAGGHGPRFQRTLSPSGRRQRGNGKLVPEGVEGRVPYKGPLSPFLYQLVGGLRAGMGYCGTKTIEELRTDARFIQVSPASVRESHPHDIAITQEAPNYTAEFTSVEEH